MLPGAPMTARLAMPLLALAQDNVLATASLPRDRAISAHGARRHLDGMAGQEHRDHVCQP